MFVGHYSIAFAVRTEQNRIPLWVLFVAVQFLDYIWATLVLLGIEKLRVIKGFTAGSMLDSYFHAIADCVDFTSGFAPEADQSIREINLDNASAIAAAYQPS